MPFLLRSFKTNQTGQVAVLFAFMLVPICAVCGFCLDYQTTLQRVQKVQAVMDSAVLAAARIKQTGASEDDTKLAVSNFLTPQIENLGGLDCDAPSVTLTTDSQILATVECSQETSLMHLVGAEKMPFYVEAASHYTVGHLDVAFVFDASSSMNSDNRLTDLKDAAIESINILLPDGAPTEAIENTRLAMTSYATLLNAGPHFERVTGATPTRTYYHTTETKLTENDLSPGHQYSEMFIGLYDADNGDLIAELGDGAVVRVKQSELDDLTIAITLNSAHSLYADVESIRLELSGTETADKTENVPPYSLYGDGGIADLDGKRWRAGDYTLRVRAHENRDLSGLKVFDEELDFQLFVEGDTVSSSTSFTLTSTCVLDRDGDEKFTDAPPGPGDYLAYQEAWFQPSNKRYKNGGWKVGFNKYGERKEKSSCNTKATQELTNDRAALINHVSTLTTDSLTAGHLGVAWGWYLISPRWESVFDGDAKPAAYTDLETTKAIILMTDGGFNSRGHYGQGTSDEQARALCDSIKLNDVSIYTVAFNAPTSGKQLLEYCATNSGFYFNAQNAEDLKKAYKEIALSLSDLRISQ